MEFSIPGLSLLHYVPVCSNSCLFSLWHCPTISSSVIPFSSCLQSFLASGSFPMSLLFASGGQSVGASASASVLPMDIQDWSPLGLTGLIFFQSKGLSRVFSITTVWKHQFFGAQPSLRSNLHVHLYMTIGKTWRKIGEGNGTHSSILAWRTLWTVWKGLGLTLHFIKQKTMDSSYRCFNCTGNT